MRHLPRLSAYAALVALLALVLAFACALGPGAYGGP